jgi:DNA-binding MarR family transcriptional regulator
LDEFIILLSAFNLEFHHFWIHSTVRAPRPSPPPLAATVPNRHKPRIAVPTTDSLTTGDHLTLQMIYTWVMTSSEPRWLTPVEQQAWRALAGILFRLPAALESQLQRDAGLSHFEYVVLAALSEAPQRTLRMKDLAALSNGSLSRLSHVVTRLEKRGYVRRAPHPADGRHINATLTDPGHDKIVASAPGHVQAVRALVIDPLTPTELEHLHAIGTAILARITPP